MVERGLRRPFGGSVRLSRLDTAASLWPKNTVSQIRAGWTSRGSERRRPERGANLGMRADDPKSTVARISSMLRGWCGYFDQGPVITIYDLIHRYTERRIRRWLLRRSRRKGTGFGQIPDEYLYETLGLYTVPRKRGDLPRAKI
jgi:hypothetical protein